MAAMTLGCIGVYVLLAKLSTLRWLKSGPDWEVPWPSCSGLQPERVLPCPGPTWPSPWGKAS